MGSTVHGEVVKRAEQRFLDGFLDGVVARELRPGAGVVEGINHDGCEGVKLKATTWQLSLVEVQRSESARQLGGWARRFQ